jgi:tRNA modification GTPase
LDTIIAILTPPGKAAIATLAVRGPQAWAMVREQFQAHSGALPEQPSANSVRFGKLGGDDVLVAIKESAPTPSIEIHCHGGIEVVRLIEELFTQRGAVRVPWQQFLGPNTALQDLLTQAPTTRTAAILLDQCQGAWDVCMQAIEHVDADTRAHRLARLHELIPLGHHLVHPWKIVIAGAPNVGKSSLMNALAGYTRSIVSPTPGTTRDIVTLHAAIDGWPVELTDTAGIREAEGDLEEQGIARARLAVKTADLCLWLLDGSNEPIWPEVGHRWIYVINKIDQEAGWDWARAKDALRISAQSGAGLAELCDAISKELAPNPPTPGEAVPCLPEQRDWVNLHSD